MKHILLLGAGFVSDALITYIYKKTDYKITVIDKETQKVQMHTKQMSRIKIVQMEIKEDGSLDPYLASSDLVISLLPWFMHIDIAKRCLHFKKHFVSTSYAKKEMLDLHGQAKKEGVLFINEVGADPGIDHMMSMKVIDDIRYKNGKVKSFCSYGTNLPAPEYNNNPFGYKFSWNIMGFLINSSNEAQFLKDKKRVSISGEELLLNYELQNIGELGVYEVFPNRNSLDYIKYYGIQDADTVFRGTLRYTGFCETWQYIKQLELYEDTVSYNTQESTVKEIVARHLGCTCSDLILSISQKLNIEKHNLFIKKLNWLGLFSNAKLAIGDVSIFNVFRHLLELKLTYQRTETDQVILYQEIIAEFTKCKTEKITALLNYKGNGLHSGISSIVGLPAAIVSIMILENKIKLRGVHAPLHKEIYEPILEQLEKEGINIVINTVDLCHKEEG